MPVTPSGALSLVLDTARTTLANCAALRTWMGVSTVADAKARIYYCGLPAPAAGGYHTLAELQTYRPFAIVSMTNEGGMRGRADAAGSSYGFMHEGQVWVAFEDDTDTTLGPGEAELKFMNSIGAIIDALEGLAGGAGYLAVIEHTVNISRCPPEYVPDQGDHMVATLMLDWQGG